MNNDSYEDWVARVARNPEAAKPLTTGEVVTSSKAEPFGAVEFVTVTRDEFVAEVGKKGNKYIYHFYPAEKWMGCIAVFHECMSEAFLVCFKNPEQVEAAWDPEMKAWAVRVSGWADTVWGDDLALRAIDLTQHKLAEWDEKYSTKR